MKDYAVSSDLHQPSTSDKVLLNKYSQITFVDADICVVCEPNQVAELTKGEEAFDLVDIHMTQAEFDALPDSSG